MVRAVVLASATLLCAGLGWFASDPWRVERHYVESVGIWLAGLPNALFRWVPLSVAEPLFLVALLAAGTWIWRTVREIRADPAGRVPVLWRAASQLLTVAYAGIAAFYTVWGLSYARPVLEVRQSWVEDEAADLVVHPAELAELGSFLVHHVNDLYLDIHGAPDGFAPTASPRSHWEIDAAIDAGFEGVVAALDLDDDVARTRGPTKPLLSSELFSWLRIGGMYFPFTAEANINRLAPAWQRPFTMAHEKAHQRFIASENEANFHGMLACIHSDDLHARYSGWLFAQRQVLRALATADPWMFVELIRQRHPGVQRDVNAARAFWTGYDGPLSDLSHAVNDAYLRANQVRGGVKSYGRSLQLIVLYARNSEWPEVPAGR